VFGHGGNVREELVHVPFMMHGPALGPADVDCTSRNVDVFPTLIRALGLPPKPGVDGVALQDGCRRVAIATVYDNADGSVHQIAAQDETGKVMVDCANARIVAHDLIADPDAIVEVDPDTVSEALRRAVSWQAEGVEASLGRACPAAD
jgi:arylsulfatase A-like enzyme